MNPEYNRERREARARALIDLHARYKGAVYVDAVKYPGDEKACEKAYAVVTVQTTTGTTKAAASVRTRKAHRAEEVAIALAIADTECTPVLSVSRMAGRNYARGRVSSEAARILRATKIESRRAAIKWFPSHVGEDVSERGYANHNETANAVARGLTNRAAATAAVDPT